MVEPPISPHQIEGFSFPESELFVRIRVENVKGDERQENLRPQLPTAQQDKTIGRAELPHHLRNSISKGWDQSIEGYKWATFVGWSS